LALGIIQKILLLTYNRPLKKQKLIMYQVKMILINNRERVIKERMTKLKRAFINNHNEAECRNWESA